MEMPSWASVALTVCCSCAGVTPGAPVLDAAMCTPVASIYADSPSTVTSPSRKLAAGVPVVPSDVAVAVEVRPPMVDHPGDVDGLDRAWLT